MNVKDGRHEQAYLAEEYTLKELKKSYAPCQVVRLVEKITETNEDKTPVNYKTILNEEKINLALKKLFKKNSKKITELNDKLKEFLKDKETKEVSEVAGLPDFIVITKNEFIFVEVKSYQEHRSKQFWHDDRMRINENQRGVFQKIAKKYPLYIGVVVLDQNNKLISIIALPYKHILPLVNRKKTSNMLGLTPEELHEKAFEIADPEVKELLIEFENLKQEPQPTPQNHIVTVAPNKVIIAGEHAVVFGCPAISTAINSETKIEIKTKIRPSSLTIHQNKKMYRFNRELEPNINYPEKWLYDHIKLWKQTLLTSKLYPEFKDLNLSIEETITPSNLPKGTGNSAAIASATILAIHTLLQHKLTKEELFNEIQTSEHKGEITPSGIDARTVISNSPLIFQKHLKPERYEFQQVNLALPKETTLLLIDTTNSSKLNAKTHEQVERFAKATNNNTKKINEEFEPIVQAIQKELTITGNAQNLGNLFNENHALLRKYDVSCEDTEKIIQKVLAAGALGAKITGAGGQNGAIIALIWTKDLEKIRTKLKTQKTWQINFPTQGTHLNTI